ncbi:MAG: hypothetical protein AAFU85_20685 [Planctomycetota bacterium]
MNDQEIREHFAPALERLEGDIDLLREMAAMTAPDCTTVVKQIRKSVSDGHADNAAKALHKLKGMLSTFDSDGVVLEIQKMLDKTRLGKLAEVGSAFYQQEREINAAIARVRGLSEPA